jgi:hypothetical protein
MNSNPKFDNNVLSNNLKYYFENDIKLALKTKDKVFLITKNNIFNEINIYDSNIQLILSSDDNLVIEKYVVKELCYKKIIDLTYGRFHYIARTKDNQIYC